MFCELKIDYSLGRAAKTLGNMAKIVASDKFIMAMIIMVLLLIVGIIVYSSILGDDAPKEFNAITDIFGGGVAKAKVSTEIKK
jgi:hypothetical protein